MRFTDLMAEFFEAAPRDSSGNYVLNGSLGSLPDQIQVEEQALFSVIDLLASLGSMCDFRFYQNGRRQEDSWDWYVWNYSPNRWQSGTEFKKLLFDRLFWRNEVLIFQQGAEIYLADNFVMESQGFAEPVFRSVVYNNQSLGRDLRRSEVIYIRLAPTPQAMALRANLKRLYSELMEEAQSKYEKSGGKNGIIKVDAIARNKKTFEKDFDELMNKRFEKFFNSKNSVLPLFEGFEYIPQNSPGQTKSTSEVSDIDNVLRQAQTAACNAFHVPPSILRGEVTNLSDAVQSTLSFALKPALKAVETEISRSLYGQDVRHGRRCKVSAAAILSVSPFEVADKVDKLVADRIYSPNGIRELLDDERIQEDWADEFTVTKNLETVGAGEGTGN